MKTVEEVFEEVKSEGSKLSAMAYIKYLALETAKRYASQFRTPSPEEAVSAGEIRSLKSANQKQSDKILELEALCQKQSYEIIALKHASHANTGELKVPGEKQLYVEAHRFSEFAHDYGISDNWLKGAKWAISEIKKLNGK